MINHTTIKKINEYFYKFQEHGQDYFRNIGEGTKILNSFSFYFTSEIPKVLGEEIFLKNNYSIKSSIGKGRTTNCPWIAILHNKETDSPHRGVYLAYLLSDNLQHIYLTLLQGVTNSSKDDICIKRDILRKQIHHSQYLQTNNEDMRIINDAYKQSTIFWSEWNCDDVDLCTKLMAEYKDIYEKYVEKDGEDDILHEDKTDIAESISQKIENGKIPFSISSIINHIADTGLLYDSTLIKRFAFSLMSKRFLILSGLAGSGKTQLALAFASALIESEQQMCVVSVGADWTNREPLLGFPNALQEGCYVKPECGALDLLIEANKEENKNKPFFLILDEMNMSYVERYFADFLSAMESHKPISLWNGNEGSEVPAKIHLPENLFIIGTINVDETTYMFSPKVLDRANVIEFKISEEEMLSFLTEMKDVDRDRINFKAAAMGASFVELAKNKEVAGNVDKIKQTLNSFFVNLKSVNAEFGYRSATEIYRFISQAEKNDDTENKLTDNQILDCAMVQKLLPKLHGSRKKLEPVLQALWKECFDSVKQQEILSIAKEHVSKASFPLTADKLQRMYEAAYANGFTSFAEA